ncbi:MAG TPA: phage tail sheath C-terminal domain-containing protein [Puia sp.]|uniref:phage tail sheath family protein n=1 Tax=Puia sp. TaxID=2045100 RepID=UPI002B99909B|nr:phage tail sheath C-terminal domain-containing protein [Puia sp.]HVU99501.1 phage tail sheath C-terminal domain-containing protein [Puia sp.]
MNQPTIPGVYIQEIPNLPPSIVSVPTAIPAFIGYTEKDTQYKDADLHLVPFMIENIMDYQRYFGLAAQDAGLSVAFSTDSAGNIVPIASVDENKRSKFLMYYALQLFFDNGGGECYIVSVNKYTADGSISEDDLQNGLDAIEKLQDCTLIVFPDSMGLSSYASYYLLHTKAIAQCVKLQDRFTVMDLYRDKVGTPAKIDNTTPGWQTDVKKMRNAPIGGNPSTGGLSGTVDDLKYAAVYFPRIFTGIEFRYDETKVAITGSPEGSDTMAKLKQGNNQYYNIAKNALTGANLQMLLPAAGAIVGVYAKTDDARGVWKAPANINIIDGLDLEVKINNFDQGDLNVDPTGGLSVNAIRYFPGRGSAIIWGARTLAGNDNEWRYIPVRRFFTMVEQSVKNACAQFVFEPNDTNTWVRVKAMISIYLTEQWKSGALMGTTAQEAFYIHIGLGQTMTEVDLWEGRMIVQIGMAAVRPAEFIILQFVQKMLSES